MKAYFSSEKTSFEAAAAKYGKTSNNPHRAQYEQDIRERTEKKLKWGIENRWEQRELDDIYNNSDVRAIQYKDFAKQMIEAQTISIREFKSVEEIYYYLENMFTEGINEDIIMKALNIFIRDAGKFTEKDLEHKTFKAFVREISQNLITFSSEESYIKVAQFLDMY